MPLHWSVCAISTPYKSSTGRSFRVVKQRRTKCVCTCLFIIHESKICIRVSHCIIQQFGWALPIFQCKFLTASVLVTSFRMDRVEGIWNGTRKWLLEQNWTSECTSRWVNFYNQAPRILIASRTDDRYQELLSELPKYVDLQPEQCKCAVSNSVSNPYSFSILIVSSLLFRFMCCANQWGISQGNPIHFQIKTVLFMKRIDP